jgi:hypothetical protein
MYGQFFAAEQLLCKCCTRRAMLTGAIIANVGAEKISQAVEGSIPSADVRLSLLGTEFAEVSHI